MILVTGADGACGNYVTEAFRGRDPLGTDIGTLDITDREAVRSAIQRHRPEAVLHLAAETDVDRCEREPEHAFLVNARGTENLAAACAEIDTVMIYISTGAVFSGEKAEPYSEEDATGPVNVYGRSKLAGEEAVRRLCKRHFILRAGWLIGGGSRDKKFIIKVLRRMEGSDRVRAVADKFGTLTYGRHLLRIAASLFETRSYGLHHVAHAGMVSRHDIAVELARLAGRQVAVEAVGSEAFPLPAPRGRSEALDGGRLGRLGLALPGWQEALAEYVEELRREGLV